MIDYTAAAKTYDNTRTHSDEIIARFCAVVPLDGSTAVLDFGCGTGNYLARIQQRFGCQCYGVEPSEGMRAKALDKFPALQIVAGDHLTILFPDEKFDFAYMTDVIHHVPDLNALFRELRRVLKASGRLCVATESHAQIENRFYNCYFPSLAANEKQRYPDIDKIVTRAREAGLTLLSAEMMPRIAPCQVTDHFIQNVTEKNWSMFRLLSEEEFSTGLQAVVRDRGRTFEATGAGGTLVWFCKSS